MRSGERWKSSGLRFPGDGSGSNVSLIGGNPGTDCHARAECFDRDCLCCRSSRRAIRPQFRPSGMPIRRQPSPAASVRLSPTRSRGRHAFNTIMRAGLVLDLLMVGGLEARPRDGRALHPSSAKSQKVHPDPGPPPTLSGDRASARCVTLKPATAAGHPEKSSAFIASAPRSNPRLNQNQQLTPQEPSWQSLPGSNICSA